MAILRPGIKSNFLGTRTDADFPLITTYLKNKQTFISSNLSADTRLQKQERDVLKDVEVNAVVMTPIFTSGILRGAFVVAQNTQRDWDDDEISVIKEVALRTQGAVAHALSQSALKESEERYRLFITALSQMVYRMSADWKVMILMEGKTVLADMGANPDWFEEYIPDSEKANLQACIKRLLVKRYLKWSTACFVQTAL